jgi:hypothetical protein
VEDRHRRPVPRDPVDLDLRASDHEVDVDAGDVDAFVAANGSLDRRGRPPVGDVAGGVLVEQRLQEQHAGLTDAAVARHQSDLAEASRSLVRLELALDQLAPVLRLDVDDPSLLERELCPWTIPPATASGRVAATVPSTRRQSGAVRTSSVGMFAT